MIRYPIRLSAAGPLGGGQRVTEDEKLRFILIRKRHLVEGSPASARLTGVRYFTSGGVGSD